ncbi:MAG: SAM-dependent methyltransferase [Opitutales bacterium]
MRESAKVVEQAREYYDSGDADQFYFHVWGGEDIHIGLYENTEDDIFEASRRTVQRMTEQLPHRLPGSKVLDIGAGYGGSARFLAKEKGMPVTCLNLSTVQNERNRSLNQAQNLSILVEVVDGSFEELPFADGSYEVVWSQDAILHSGDRLKVFQEVDRVLKAGGDFIFTDPMQAENVDAQILQPVLNRIHLASMGSIDTYRGYADQLGWETVGVHDLTEHLPNHYARVKAVLEAREEELKTLCSEDYRARMKQGLDHWINAGRQGALAWGILHFRKPA